MAEKIWYEDIGNFITQDNYHVILPSGTMTFVEKMNAIVRLFIYIGLLLALIKSEINYLFMGVVAAVVSIVIVEFDKKQKTQVDTFLQEKNLAIVNDKVCTKSTVENPFMNPSIADIAYNPDRPPACDLNEPEVQKQVEENFNKRLFKDVGDLYATMSSQREFYTVPATTIPNDQTNFAEWLYGIPPTCKEGNGLQCAQNINVNFPHMRAGASATL